jgi:hypothetical protein
VRRVQARARRPGGAVWWLGPIVGLALGVCGLIGFGGLINLKPLSTSSNSSVPPPTALVITITPSPVIPTPTLAPAQIVPTLVIASPTPTGLYIGGEAVVAGTGSSLRLRSDPGLQSTTLKTVDDGTRLKILEGPREADGLTWWRLEYAADGAQGWAAEKFLTPATAP